MPTLTVKVTGLGRDGMIESRAVIPESIYLVIELTVQIFHRRLIFPTLQAGRELNMGTNYLKST